MADFEIPLNAGIAGVANSRRDDFVAPAVVLTGSFPVHTEIETLVTQGADLAVYTLVGRISASGKITVCNPALSDGSQIPIGILASVAKQSGSDQPVSVIKTGVFNPDVITYDDSTTGFANIAAVRAALRTGAPCLFLNAPNTGS